MHYSAITTVLMGALLAGANAHRDKRSHNNYLEKRQSYYYSASQAVYSQPMIISSASYAYPSADTNSYYSSSYASSSAAYYSSGASTSEWSPGPTPHPVGGHNNGNPGSGNPGNGNPGNGTPGNGNLNNNDPNQLQQASPNTGSSFSASGCVILGLGALTGVAGFLL